MACQLYGVKILYEPMLANDQLDHCEQNSDKLESKYNVCYEEVKLIRKCCLSSGSLF